MTGTLSYHAISVLHDMQAEPGEAIERFSGTRAATTFRNDPIASAGTNAIPATARPIEVSYRQPQLFAVAVRRIDLRVRRRGGRHALRHDRDRRERGGHRLAEQHLVADHRAVDVRGGAELDVRRGIDGALQ